MDNYYGFNKVIDSIQFNYYTFILSIELRIFNILIDTPCLNILLLLLPHFPQQIEKSNALNIQNCSFLLFNTFPT